MSAKSVRMVLDEWVVRSLLFVSFLLIAATDSAYAVSADARVIGEAFDLANQEPLYSEIHCVNDEALSREVIYRDSDQKLIAYKTLNYRSGATIPSVVQSNYYSGEAIAVGLNQDEVTMVVRDQEASGPGRMVSVRPSADLPLVIDAGFDAFVIENWDSLMVGESKRFQFPFAARESLVKLRIRSADCTYDTKTDQCFSLEMDNWLLKLLVPPIELGYDPRLKRLSRYRGLSNIGDGSGEGLVVDIHYDYEDLPLKDCSAGDLKPGSGIENAEFVFDYQQRWSL